MDDLTVRPLDPTQLDAWLAFFDGDAFADNPGWGGCYCRCFTFGARGWDAWDAACADGSNRAAMVAGIGEARIDGMLARRGGKIVGWTQFGPTERFCTPQAPLAPVEPGLASLVCFVIAPAHRRTGVARALLRGACDELARRGFTAVDVRAMPEGDRPAMDEFTGPIGLFESEGFAREEVGERRVRLRKRLVDAG